MLRTHALSTLVTFALASTSYAGNFQVNFSGGSGAPLTITLPQAVSFTVTSNTASSGAVFVFQGVGNVLAGTSPVTGNLGYFTNGGSGMLITGARNSSLGVVTANDLSLLRLNGSPGVGLNDVLLLSAGSVKTTSNVTAAAPPSGLYSAILTDKNGIQLGVGAASFLGDYNLNGVVDAADYVVWRKTDGTPAGYNLWRAHFGQTSGGGAAALASAEPMSAAVPEPTSALLLILGATVVGCCGRR